MKTQADSPSVELGRRSVMRLALAAAGGLAAARAAEAAQARSGGGIVQPARDAVPVAVLVGEGATLIDFAGPWEVLSSASYADCPGFNVFAVAAKRQEIISDDGRGVMGAGKPRSGLRVVPDYSFDDAPQPRILLIGAQMNDDAATLDWIRQVARHADLVASVCTGAFILAKTGLLDGRRATTNRHAYDDFEKTFPKVSLVRGVRFVEDGPFATATGLTAGIDLALRITDRVYGRSVAQKIADYEEWRSTEWIRDA